MNTIRKEDYEEPRCLLDLNASPERPEGLRRVPLQRVIQKLDEHTDRRDFDAARRHLEYWLTEARAIGDRQGEFSLLNERMGFFRKQGEREAAMESAESALALLDAVGSESAAAGTCYVNAGTVWDHFGEPGRALELFSRALEIYSRELPETDPRVGGLYNNMGLAQTALGQYAAAEESFRAALGIMTESPLEMAVTWLNLADNTAAELGEVEAEDRIQSCLSSAAACLDEPELPRDGYYAFVSEKCAPGFDHYGWFAYAGELRERSEAIYAGLGAGKSLL